jgi:hypothetical protein
VTHPLESSFATSDPGAPSSPPRKSSTTSPANSPLPSPIVLQSAPASPDSPSPKTNAVIPAEDLKPLYDFTIDCKACQAKLSTAQADLTRERDDALRIARGGSILRRITRAAKWFAIGTAAGAVAAKAAH